MPADTPAADRLTAAVKAARSLNLWNVDLTIQTAEALIAENRRLAARITQLEDRIILGIDAQGDADDLRRENASLRELLAAAPTGDAAIAKLREWSTSAKPEYEWAPGAIQIAMSVAMARTILEEIDQLRAAVHESAGGAR